MASSKHLQLRLLLQYMEEEGNCNDIIMTLLLKKRALMQQSRKHRFWTHFIIQRRKKYGAYYHLVRHLELDHGKYHEYFRMSPQKLELILAYIGPLITKKSVIRESIDAKQRLVICLRVGASLKGQDLHLYRFLATGETYVSLGFQYRVGVTTISKIVPEVCEAIWTSMLEIYMPIPKSPEDWNNISMDFAKKWNYPNCIGALDGKHVIIQAPGNSGSLFYNYKHSFSIILLALVDASYRFIYADIGSYGRQSDGGIYANSSLGKALCHPHVLNIPNDKVLEGGEDLGPMPFVVIGDEAFPLQRHIMRPFPGKRANGDQQTYNYRHSRARRIVENAFGLLASRWRVYHTKMAVLPDRVNTVVKATIILHNFLHNETGHVTSEATENGTSDVVGLNRLSRVGTRGTDEAIEIRNKFSEYFRENPLQWQTQYVERGLRD